jgi:negative regulator of sigma-B (phosphoserine phosphatase)
MNVPGGRAGILDFGVAGAPLEPATISGDLHVFATFEGGALVAAIDGLGHGVEAAGAAGIAAEILRMNAGAPPAALVQRCHQGLHGTRGAVMSVASFDAADNSLTWLGVGNVEGVVLRSGATTPRHHGLTLRGGVVGYHLPTLHPVRLSLSPHDTLILVTDGIRERFADQLDASGSAEQIAQSILRLYAKGSDDALVVVARYRGTAS